MKDFNVEELQEGRDGHSKNGGPSVKILRVEERESRRIVFFKEIGSRNGRGALPVGDFIEQYQRRKRRI